MEPIMKRSGKKGKEKKDEAQKPRKSEYLAKISEMNNILAQARKETCLIEGIYTDSEKRYEQVREDMDDIIKYLEYEIKVSENEIASYNSGIENYTKEMQKQKKYYGEIFTQMDEEYETKKRQLTEKIQSVNAKLNSFEEMRRQREDFLNRQETLTKLVDEINTRNNQDIYEAEKQAIIEQDKLQKEMENRLEQLALDFGEATDVRIGETTNRIIGENIKLGNMLTCQQGLMTRIRNNYTTMKKFQRRAIMDLELKQDEYSLAFERYSKNGIKIVEYLQLTEDLTRKIEELKKLIKTNRRLKRKTTELECFLKEVTEEYNSLEKSLEDVEELIMSAKGNLNHHQKNILKLQIILFEAAKKVKEAMECEYTALPVMEKIAHEGEQSSKTDLTELEEEKEQMYVKRESLIEEILITLQSAILSLEELHLTASSIESYDINLGNFASFDHTPTSKRSIERTEK